jgi:hypothetical protein
MNPIASVLDIYASAMKCHLELGNTLLKGLRRVRQSQLDQINASIKEHESFLDQLTGAGDYSAMHSLQSSLLNVDAERVASYWNLVPKEMLALRSGFAAAMQDYAAGAAEGLRHQAEDMQSSLSQASSALFKNMLNPQAGQAYRHYETMHDDAGDSMHSRTHNGSGNPRTRKADPKHARPAQAH